MGARTTKPESRPHSAKEDKNRPKNATAVTRSKESSDKKKKVTQVTLDKKRSNDRNETTTASTPGKSRGRVQKKPSTTKGTPNKSASEHRSNGRGGKKKDEKKTNPTKRSSRETKKERSVEREDVEKTQKSTGKQKKKVEGGKGTAREEKSTAEKQSEEDKANVKTAIAGVVEDDDNTLVSDPSLRQKMLPAKEANVKALLDWIVAKGVKGIQEEFHAIKKETEPAKEECSQFHNADNARKNRYKDVPCFEESRVQLKNHPAGDYIHANYCSSSATEKRFICTQGPMEATMNDFWTMVYQEEAEFIVMLCNFIEQNKAKCHKYVPVAEGEIVASDDYTIQCMAVHSHNFPEHVCIRKLQLIKKGADPRTLTHVHWESWADRGVPPIDHSVFKLLAKVNKTPKPIVVHCSAGIGRTGTIVVIQIALEMLAAGESLAGGLGPILRKLRKQRTHSVQTENQYIFIHRVLLHHFKDAIEEEKTALFCEEYKKLV